MAKIAVAPLVGAWIEIQPSMFITISPLVAPLGGAWIEIWWMLSTQTRWTVAPRVGAWIEIPIDLKLPVITASLPSWERGLKSVNTNLIIYIMGRSPRGSVD